MRTMLTRSTAIFAALLLGAPLLSACAVGPDFTRPAPPDAAGYAPGALPTETAGADVVQGGDVQHFASGQDIPGEWWTLFHSQTLDTMIEAALKNNPDLDAAQASLRQAREAVYAGQGALFPSVTGNLSSEREKISGLEFGPQGQSSIFNVTTASLSVSYGIDIWGGERREIESLESQADYQNFQLEASYLTLTSNLVVAAVQEASLRAQIAATQDIIKDETDQLNVVKNQFELGGVAKSDVLEQETTLAQAKATLPPLEKQLAQTRDQLMALMGKFPNQDTGEQFNLGDLQLPRDLPVSLPSQLVEQRPDIRAAEATLHAASAKIGVAIANELPQFSITGQAGSSAADFGHLFTPGTGIWSIAGGLAQPIFDGGTLLHERRGADAAFDVAAAQYRSTVISAFKNVADCLRALESDADSVKAQAVAERSAEDSLNLSHEQFKLGAITYLTLLNAERDYQQTKINLVQAEASRYSDTAALFQALGGGWWHRDDAAPANAAAEKSSGEWSWLQSLFD